METCLKDYLIVYYTKVDTYEENRPRNKWEPLYRCNI